MEFVVRWRSVRYEELLRVGVEDAMPPLCLYPEFDNEVKDMNDIHKRPKTLVYDLKLDKKAIERTRKHAAKGNPIYDDVYGEVYSPQWWESIEQKKLHIRKKNGIVMQMHKMKMGHFFWMKSKGKDKLSECQRTIIPETPLTRKKLDEIYLPGSHVRIISVQIRYSQHNPISAGKSGWITLQVWISHPQEGDPAPPVLKK